MISLGFLPDTRLKQRFRDYPGYDVVGCISHCLHQDYSQHFGVLDHGVRGFLMKPYVMRGFILEPQWRSIDQTKCAQHLKLWLRVGYFYSHWQHDTYVAGIVKS